MRVSLFGIYETLRTDFVKCFVEWRHAVANANEGIDVGYSSSSYAKVLLAARKFNLYHKVSRKEPSHLYPSQ